MVIYENPYGVRMSKLYFMFIWKCDANCVLQKTKI